MGGVRRDFFFAASWLWLVDGGLQARCPFFSIDVRQ